MSQPHDQEYWKDHEPSEEDELPAENFVDQAERSEAQDSNVGDGTPETAPEVDDDVEVDPDDAPEGDGGELDS